MPTDFSTSLSSYSTNTSEDDFRIHAVKFKISKDYLREAGYTGLRIGTENIAFLAALSISPLSIPVLAGR